MHRNVANSKLSLDRLPCFAAGSPQTSGSTLNAARVAIACTTARGLSNSQASKASRESIFISPPLGFATLPPFHPRTPRDYEEDDAQGQATLRRKSGKFFRKTTPSPCVLSDLHICGFGGVLNFSPSFRRRPESTFS
ncbi:MAG TPA: hypothetical protein PKZ97_14940, partial [Azospirillaceae bacterium]|nr:hypothetical protein [Azospirillaceae bacterium]